MITIIVEATNAGGGGMNWGKFLVGLFTDEWSRKAAIYGESPGPRLLNAIGWGPANVMVFDLQTREGAVFRHGGNAHADLNDHRIWVCPMFEPFLAWLYTQPFETLSQLPPLVNLDDAPSAMQGYRRGGKP